MSDRAAAHPHPGREGWYAFAASRATPPHLFACNLPPPSLHFSACRHVPTSAPRADNLPHVRGPCCRRVGHPPLLLCPRWAGWVPFRQRGHPPVPPGFAPLPLLLSLVSLWLYLTPGFLPSSSRCLPPSLNDMTRLHMPFCAAHPHPRPAGRDGRPSGRRFRTVPWLPKDIT